MNLVFRALLSVTLLSLTFAQGHAAGDPDAGKAKTTACAACHGPNGNSLSPAFPNLAGQGEKYLLKQLRDVKSGTRSIPEMTGQLDALSDEDLANISAYYASLPAATQGASKEELLTRGEQIWRAGVPSRGVPACTGCHGPAGQGIDSATFPRLAGQHSDYIAKQLVAWREETRTNDGDSRIMRGVAEGLSNRDIAAVSEFISGLQR